ncbi:sulfatase-like hydrolase/transferase [Verrucomicrobium spinosum]|uniref:sulfatase-like hydrolase/transferase n=1 Tax=Verrucomicrobium spinosum TaxID=2736 RepID=UPI0012E2004E|nr:sulfatase-like hydrolase/transferase [Verrucomicrobium spinosum]
MALTPNLDKLAAEGVRYRNAYANAPVCSAARSTLITGMCASSLGVQNHRSGVAIPAGFKLYPEVLRAAGYYCTNNVKTDYNVAGTGNNVWSESSKKAHYRHRAAGQPFFAVFNFTSSHESQVAPKKGKDTFRVPPEKIVLPPYHPDTPQIRKDWANYYDQITLMDSQVGEVLKELEKEGLANDTIVFYYGDHGGALPGGKRHLHDAGTRVPLIIRIPEKWASWRPDAPGSWVEQLVCFADFPATVFSLCGIAQPANYEGRAFLGNNKIPPRNDVFLFRGRMDERYDTARAIRTGSHLYIRNYSPHRPWGQPYSYPFEVQPSMRSWFAEYQAGRCNPAQSAYWQPKSGEELYDASGDPYNIKNLAAAPEQAARLQEMAKLLRQKLLQTRDTGFIPEGMYTRLAGDKTLYDYAQSSNYPLERIIDVADQACSGKADGLLILIKALEDPNPVIRYWAATGCLVLKENSAPAKDKLLGLAKSDDWADVRVVAAEALGWLHGEREGLAALKEVIASGGPYEILAALNALDFMTDAGHVPLEEAQAVVRGLTLKEPADRIQRRLLERSR